MTLCRAGYVSLSRARYGVKIFIDDRDRLASRIVSTSKQTNALEHLREKEWAKKGPRALKISPELAKNQGLSYGL